jgi:DNA-binding NtrC family response regulator
MITKIAMNMPGHVLLIDDDTDDIELFGEALADADKTATFQHFNDAAALTDAATTGSIKKPNIIFLDINMSTVSGWHCLQFFKSHQLFCNVPVVMYSTSHKTEVELALKEGAFGFVTKPNDYKILVNMLREIVATPASNLKEKLAAY